MKVRDSGMPEEEMWAGFFDPTKVLEIFGLDRDVLFIGPTEELQ